MEMGALCTVTLDRGAGTSRDGDISSKWIRKRCAVLRDSWEKIKLKGAAMQEVRQALEDLNQAWRNKRFDLLEQCFDDDVVMRGPELKELGRGRSLVVQSYRDFMQKSDVIDYTESNHFVHEWSNTAVAGFDWSMTWI